ncbi:E3 ubiquitin-protein ligase SH3RF1-like isoform X2 [Lethenteron reissneri]|uniref:E3 ubiquitin-protein ligase SH3RF1-like isoform X2 n=1 Tax=Lethenteron reissneri TaxID=7753 RepID=UPI002AB6800A|nr:E3 ubiquitin-protein ligase SH3RF1-like isoform X2 [Lethenteron reissneri]
MDESSLLDLLECPVCLERLDSTAKVLPCQHTFCKRCLQSIVSSRQGELRCPECRTLVRSAVDDLPSNILLLRLLDGITRGGHGPHISPGQPGVAAVVPARVNRAARLAAAAMVAGTPLSSNGALPAQTLSRSAASAANKSLPVVPCARALYTYEGKEPGDLPFSKGDLVFLRRRIDDSWYHGETSAGAQGFFPASYVQVLRALPTPAVPLLLQPAATPAPPGTPTVGAAQPQARPAPPPQCRALYDFAVSGGEQDKDCLTFSKDEVLTVIRRVDENWAEGMLGDKIGIFPISFVEFNTMAKLLLGLESANIHTLGEALGQPQPSTSSASSASSSSSSSSSSVTSSAAAVASATAGDAGRKNAKKRHSFTSLTMSNKASGAGAQAQAAHQHRHSCDISAPVLISSSNPAAAARIVAAATGNGLSSSAPSQIYIGTTGLIVTTAPTSPVTTVAPVTFLTEGAPPSGPTEGQALPAVVSTPAVVPGMPLPRPALPSAAGTTEPAVPVPRPPPQQYPLIQIFVALYPYKPQKADELELRKGEMYRVLERCQDGWYKGSSLRTGTAGVFPGNYVAPVNRAPPVPQQKLPPPVGSANSSCSTSCTSSRAVTVTVPIATVTTSQASNGGGLSACPLAAPPTSPRLGPATATRHVAQGPAQNGVRPAPSSTDKPVAAVPPIQSQGGSPRLSAASARPQPAAPLPAPVTALPPAPPCPCPSLSSALASVASAITPPNVSAASLDEQAGLGGSGVSSAPVASAASGGATAGGKSEKGEKDKKERKSSFLKILSSASAKRKSRSPPLSASPPPPQSTHDAQQPEAHAMGATAAAEVGGHGRSLTPPVAPPPRQPCSAMAPVRPETKPLQRERYRVVVPYPPQSDVELELREGDVVFVHRKRDDGWYKGTLQRNGKTGLFPGSFVESF